MNCEIEFLPVGDGSKPGDAIVVRYGEPDAYELMVIDGGTVESGKKLVEHIRAEFGKGVVISHLLLTHSDADHASGLREIISGLPVESLWLHVPWLSAAAARPYFANKKWTDDRLAQLLYGEYDMIAEIIELATKNRVPAIQEPFATDQIGPFRVLSPYKSAYPLLMAQFDRTPEADQRVIESAGMWIGKQPGLAGKLFDKAAAKIQKRVEEKWEKERLRDGGVTSASNESSVVLYGDFGGDRRMLLTGDAGVLALSMAAGYAEAKGLVLKKFRFVQIPHHGSRRNVGPTIMNRLFGPIQPKGTAPHGAAYVSAPKDDDTHPRGMVVNAFLRRGYSVSATQGKCIVYCGGFPARQGYEKITRLPFVSDVDDYE